MLTVVLAVLLALVLFPLVFAVLAVIAELSWNLAVWVLDKLGL